MAEKQSERAVFGGGCFWCTEAVFAMLKGVVSAKPGYAGGTSENPTYDDVCSGATGHAEVVDIMFDPAQISYRDLLTVFFATHDPTTVNRQGNDIGTQYRSVILYATPEQKAEAEKYIQELASSAGIARIVTEIVPLDRVYPAEGYHQRYYETHKDAPYCDAVITPKIEKVQERFEALLAHTK